MKASLVAAVGLGFVATLTSSPAVGQDTTKGKAAAPASAELKDVRTKASYCIGLDIGKNLKTMGAADIDADLVARGIKDALSGAQPKLSADQIQAVMKEFQAQLMAKQMDSAKSAADKNKREGEAFLAANKSKPGVVTLPSGLQYKVLKEGTGPTPTANSTVKAHYRGTLIDGTEFDSSLKRGEPIELPVNGVIAGWTEALQKMKVGSKWQLFIPSELAYGANPRPGGPIGPNAVLLFDLELLGVQ